MSTQETGRSAPVVIYAASSADGYLAPVDGSVGWLEEFGDAPDFGYDAFFAEVGSIVVGRTTFEQVRDLGAWTYEGKPTAVLTGRDDLGPEPLPEGVRLDRGTDLTWLVQQLQAEAPSGATWLLGGGAVHQAFLADGLVDEIWTHVMPVLLGDGIRLFPPAYAARPLTLIESRTYHGARGVVLLRYRVG